MIVIAVLAVWLIVAGILAPIIGRSIKEGGRDANHGS